MNDKLNFVIILFIIFKAYIFKTSFIIDFKLN